MLLTDKAKEDFLNWYNNHSIRFLLSWTIFEDLPLVVQNALIIECFIYRQIWQNVFYKEYRHTAFGDYTFAINQSIKKCNEIYNNLNAKTRWKITFQI